MYLLELGSARAQINQVVDQSTSARSWKIHKSHKSIEIHKRINRIDIGKSRLARHCETVEKRVMYTVAKAEKRQVF